MKIYRVKPHKDWKEKKWIVSAGGFFGFKRTLDDRQVAIELAKKMGRNNPPSRVEVYDRYKMVSTWPYDKLPPRKKYGRAATCDGKK